MDVATSTVGQRPTTLYSFTPGAREAQEPPLQSLLAQFQLRYPTASLIAELLMIHDGNYVVRAMVQLGGTILVSGMAAAADIELAEDRAKVRALETLTLQPAPNAYELQVRLNADDRQLEPVAQPPLLAQLPKFEQADSMPASKLVSPEELPEPIPSLDNLHEPETETFLEEISEEIESDSRLPQREAVLATGSTIAALESTVTPVETTIAPPPVTGSSWSDLPAPEPETSHATTDLSDVIAQTTVELKRLGWTNAKGRTHLEQTYGKRSRQQLTDSELLDFLRCLESQPSPSQTPF